MVLPDFKPMELQYLDLWFANLVDTINFDLGKIEGAVGALSKQLVTIDTAPIENLKTSLDDLVNKLSDGFDKINNELAYLSEKVKLLEGK